MSTATVPSYNRIALIFDFDGTLAPDSFRSLLESCGIDKDAFERERLRPLVAAGWDTILAKMYCLIEESRRRGGVITDQHLARVGRQIRFFDGVPEMFERMRARARDLVPGIDVEFYLVSSGILEIARATPIADQFAAMHGCEFHCDEDGRIAFVKRIVTHSEKVRYLLQFSKGASTYGEPRRPEAVFRDVPEDELHVPLSQVIYAGDGASDLPVFRLLNEQRGLAIGVVKGDTAADWDYYDEMGTRRHVQNLAPADYAERSELMRSLTLAVESICKQIALRQLGRGE